MGSVLRAENLAKIYPAVGGARQPDRMMAPSHPSKAWMGHPTGARGEVVLFRGLSFEVKAGEMVAIVGESGSGKSSLLHLLAALDKPTEGEVWVGDGGAEIRLGGPSARQAAEFRNRDVGYVWQFHYLLPEFTAEENVAMPLLARGESKASALQKARQWLSEVGLAGRAEHRSGDLDGKTGEAVWELIRKLHGEHLLTSVLVTHNMEFAMRCGRVMRLRDGRLEEVGSS